MRTSSTNQLTVLNASLLFSCSVVPNSVTPWTAECQASLSCTVSWSLLKLMSTELVMPFNHLVLCCPLLLPSSIFPSIRVFFSEFALCVRWPKYWSFSFRISLSNEYSAECFSKFLMQQCPRKNKWLQRKKRYYYLNTLNMFLYQDLCPLALPSLLWRYYPEHLHGVSLNVPYIFTRMSPLGECFI